MQQNYQKRMSFCRLNGLINNNVFLKIIVLTSQNALRNGLPLESLLYIKICGVSLLLFLLKCTMTSVLQGTQ